MQNSILQGRLVLKDCILLQHGPGNLTCPSQAPCLAGCAPTLLGRMCTHLQSTRDFEGVELPRGALDGLVQRVRVARSTDA